MSILKRNQIVIDRRNTQTIELDKESNNMVVDAKSSVSLRISPKRNCESKDLFGNSAGFKTPFKIKKPYNSYSEKI